MSYRDALKGSQSGGSDYPKLTVDLRLQMKKVEDKSLFSYYDKETKETKLHKGPIDGILIGSAMQLTRFDQNYGNNGGSYNSTPFIAKANKILVFAPDGKRAVTGDYEAVCDWFSKNELPKPQIKRLHYVATKKGLLSVETGIVTDIDLMKSFDKDTFLDFKIRMIPKLYLKSDTSWSAQVHKSLKIASGPVAYAHIEKGEPITDTIAEELKIMDYVKMFTEWKEFTMGGGQTQEEIIQKNEASTQQAVDNFEQPPFNDIPPPVEDDFDDLPF